MFVADDHPIYLEGLLRALKARPELEVLGSAADGHTALASLRELQPDVALLDLRLPGLTGEEILHALVRDGTPTAVAILSGETDGRTAFDTVRNGASAYLTKDAGRDEIGDAIVTVARGGTVLAPEIQAGLASELRGRGRAEGPVLTEREHEVLRLIADGLSGPDIARRLHLSPSTVKTHTQHLYEKLGVGERAAAVAEAMRRGLLE